MNVALNLTPRELHDTTAPPEEVATAGVLSLEANGTTLTEGVPLDDDVLQPGPLASGYPLAEWLVWNWWRLRWEPTPARVGRSWAFAHRLSTVGGGYRWPNVEIATDGERVRLTSTPSVEPKAGTFRYVGAPRSEVVTAASFESAVAAFVGCVLARLGEHGVAASNLEVLAQDLESAKADDALSTFRRLEATLGYDMGEGDETMIRRRLSDIPILGEQAVVELAADAASVGAHELTESLERAGFDAQPTDGVSLATDETVAPWGATAAWRIGVAMARRVREQEVQDGEPVTNCRLAQMAGTSVRVLTETGLVSDCLSFELERGDRSRIALRSNWLTGRRFDLARLLAERLLQPVEAEPLRTATKSYTYRQKAQRAFAAEFLAPMDAIEAFLEGDYSDDQQSEAAEHFEVSPYTIRFMLMNNHRMGRDGAFDRM